jgi:hypothetical protein
MKNNFLRQAVMLAGFALIAGSDASAQVSYSAGPGLENDKDNKMNRMLGGDETSFYCYRVRSKGKGTSFFVEKYNKSTLKPEFSKEVNLGEDEGQTKIEDVEYAAGNVFVFRRQYDKKADKMTLFFQTVSSSGQISPDLKEVLVVSSDHYEFVDFEIFPNPSQTKFLIKASHKPNKAAEYKTEFILMDASGKKKLWTKEVAMNLDSRGSIGYDWFTGSVQMDDDNYGCIGINLDDKDNIYFCYTDLTKTSTKKEKRYKLDLYTIKAGEKAPKTLTLGFDDDYYVSDIEFSKTGENELVIGGFVKDVVERKGRDLVKCGIFSFKVNVENNTVAGKATNFFDDKMLAALESSKNKSRYFKYKMDYIIPAGDAVYYVGEQYSERFVRNTSNSGFGGMGAVGGFGASNGNWVYEYMDVIIAKLNSKGEFEWVKNSPLRQNLTISYGHVFKQYIAYATQTNLYILNDDHPKNIERYQKDDFEPKDLKSVTGIHGSNFVCNTISLKDGKVTNRTVLMKNDDYCFAPIQERNIQFIPPSDTEIFVKGKNEIFIYTEDRGKDQFGRVKFN